MVTIPHAPVIAEQDGLTDAIDCDILGEPVCLLALVMVEPCELMLPAMLATVAIEPQDVLGSHRVRHGVRALRWTR